MAEKAGKVVNRISTGEMAARIRKTRRQVQLVCKVELGSDRDGYIDEWLEERKIALGSIETWSRGERRLREDVAPLFALIIQRRERRRAGKEEV